MKPIDPNQPAIEMRYRTLLILWFGMSIALILYLVFIRLVPVEPAPNQKVTLILNTLGLIPVAGSFLIKQVLLGKANESQQLQLVHTAYILAFALCEISALLGLFDNRVTGSNYYYIGFAIGGLGMLLHFPRKQHLIDAAQRQV